jgi:transcriptional regulator with XRE-family HTH domain
MKNTRDIFRENLRTLIAEKGYKLEKAAEACEISLSFLNQLLAGRAAYSPETLDKICSGLECNPDRLFSDPRGPGIKVTMPTNVDSLILDQLQAIQTKLEMMPVASGASMSDLESHIIEVGGAELLAALRGLTRDNAVFVGMVLGLPDVPAQPVQAPSASASRQVAPTSRAKKSAG